MDRFHEGYDGKILFFCYFEVPYLDDKILQLRLAIVNDLWMLIREGLEILALLCSFFNSQLQFNLGVLENVLIVGFQSLLT